MTAPESVLTLLLKGCYFREKCRKGGDRCLHNFNGDSVSVSFFSIRLTLHPWHFWFMVDKTFINTVSQFVSWNGQFRFIGEINVKFWTWNLGTGHRAATTTWNQFVACLSLLGAADKAFPVTGRRRFLKDLGQNNTEGFKSSGSTTREPKTFYATVRIQSTCFAFYTLETVNLN